MKFPNSWVQFLSIFRVLMSTTTSHVISRTFLSNLGVKYSRTRTRSSGNWQSCFMICKLTGGIFFINIRLQLCHGYVSPVFQHQQLGFPLGEATWPVLVPSGSFLILLTLRKTLVGRDCVVFQSFGYRPADCVTFGDGERSDLLMSANFCLKHWVSNYKPWRNESETAAIIKHYALLWLAGFQQLWWVHFDPRCSGGLFSQAEQPITAAEHSALSL